MNKWKYQLKFKHLLSEDGDSNTAKHVGGQIAKAIRPTIEKHFSDDFTIDDILCQLEAINSVEQWQELCNDEVDRNNWIDYPPLRELNGTLEGLYDWCDRNNVWCGI